MRRIDSTRGVTAVALVMLLAAHEAATQRHRSEVHARPGRPIALAGGPYPNAGRIVTGPHTPPVATLFALQHDPYRRVLWLGTENSVGGANRPDVFMVETGFHRAVSSLVTDELRATGSLSAQIDGPVDELALLVDGTLLCADFNGDQRRFDDTLFQITPTNPPKLEGVWYLDDLGCRYTCAPNGNTNQPQDRIDFVAGLAARNTLSITATNRAQQEIFVGQYLPTGVIREISLTPGTPGTWATRRVYASPTGDTVDGLDWDPDLQSFWITSTTTGLVYEAVLDRSRNAFRIVQAFAAPALAGTIAVSARRDSQNPHTLFEGEGFSFAGSYRELDTGHVGRGSLVVTDSPGTGPVFAGAVFHTDCANLPFRVVASLKGGTIRLGDRFLKHAKDPLFFWSLTSPLFAGTVAPSGAAILQLPGNLPPAFGPLHFTMVVFGDPDVDSFGIKRITLPAIHTTR